jgi:RNA polymerase sigma factor (sigma-70 family)
MANAPLSLVLRHIRKLAGDGNATDRQLLHRFAIQHEEAAFEMLVERHGQAILGLCRRTLRHEHDAEDVFQATFLTLARKASSIRKPESLGCWLYGVASRLALKVRASGAKRKTVSIVGEPVEPSAGPELCAALDEELTRLAWRYQAPIVLCYLEGKTRDEAARQLGWSLGTLKLRLSQGRKILRERLTRRGLTLSAVLAVVGLSQETVPAALVISTTRAAVHFAAGIGGFSVKAGALAESVLKGMLLGKLKIAAALILTASLVGVGAGLIAHQVQAERPELAPASANPGKSAQKRADTDQYGDPLPDGAVTRLGTVRFNHGDGLHALHFSPDGKTILSEGQGALRLWDTTTGIEHRSLAITHPSFDDETVLTPDGKSLIFLSQGFPNDIVRIWDLDQAKEVRVLTLPVRRTEQSVHRRNALSRDGRLCAIHVPQGIHVFDIETGKELYKLPKAEREVEAVIFAGRDWIVTADNKQVIDVWEARTGKPVRRFAHHAPVESLAASTHGRRLATLEHHNNPAERLLDQDAVHIWDLTTGVRMYTLPARPKCWYRNVQFAPDGQRLFASSFGRKGNTLTVWDVKTGTQIRELANAGGATIAVSPDGNRLAEAGQCSFEVWDLRTGRRLSCEDSQHARAATVLLSPAGERVFTIGYSSISTWDGTNGQRLHSVELPPYYDTVPQFSHHSADGKYALSFTGDYDHLQMDVWDIAARQRLHTLRPLGRAIQFSSAFSPDSSLLATWQGNPEIVFRIWNVRTGEEIRSFQIAAAGLPGLLFFSGDGNSLLVAGERVLGIDVASGRELFSWRLELLSSNAVRANVGAARPAMTGKRIGWSAMAASPDGTIVALVLSGTEPVEDRIVLCETTTGKIIRRWHDTARPARWREQLAFSRDGRLLASSDGDAIHVWEVATGKEVRRFQGHRGYVRSLDFNTNGRRLASGGTDSTVLIWNLAMKRRPAEPLVGSPSDREIAAWWADLLDEDPGRAYTAIWQLSDAPAASVPFLRQRLRPVTEAQVREISQHLADLDSHMFSVREKAFERLKSLGVVTEQNLRQELKQKGSPELHRRIEQLLENLTNKPLAGEPLRGVRALAVLEQMGAPEARRLLQELAAGESGAWLTQEAMASLNRLAKRR